MASEGDISMEEFRKRGSALLTVFFYYCVFIFILFYLFSNNNWSLSLSLFFFFESRINKEIC